MILNGFIHKIKNSDTAKDTIWLFILQGVDKLMPIVVAPYLMIVLGADKYGYIGFAIAVIQYLMLFIDFGFNFSATKRISIAQTQGQIRINKIASATFIAKTILFIGSVPFLLLLIYYTPGLKDYFLTVVCMLPMALGSLLNAGWLFQGLGKVRIIAIVTSICKLTIFPLVFIFVSKSEDFNIAALIHGGVYFVTGITSICIVAYYKWFKFIFVSMEDLKIELTESFPLFLSSAAGSTYTQLFTIILGIFASSTAVGTYSAAERIMRTLCLSIYHPIVTAFYPKLAKLGVEVRIKGEELLSKLTTTLIILMVILGIVLFILATSISNFMGGSYIGLEHLIRIMAITPLFIAIGGIFGQMGLLALGDNLSKKRFRNVYLLAAPLSLLMVSLLTWWFEETGTAIAMVLTELFIFVGMYTARQKDLKRI